MRFFHTLITLWQLGTRIYIYYWRARGLAIGMRERDGNCSEPALAGAKFVRNPTSHEVAKAITFRQKPGLNPTSCQGKQIDIL